MDENKKILSAPLRWSMILAAYFFVVLAIIGAFLPILPTTPFLILAAYLFSKSSPRLHLWLTSMPYFGNAIIEWERHGVIRPRAKITAISLILLTFGYTLIFVSVAYIIKIFLALLCLCLVGFIFTRKSKV